MIYDSSLLVPLYEMGEVSFLVIGRNSFNVKAENERFTAAGSCCCQNLKFENSTSSFAGYVKEMYLNTCRPCTTIIFPHLANHIIDLWCCSCRRPFLNYMHLQGLAHKISRIIVLQLRVFPLFPTLCWMPNYYRTASLKKKKTEF